MAVAKSLCKGIAGELSLRNFRLHGNRFGRFGGVRKCLWRDVDAVEGWAEKDPAEEGIRGRNDDPTRDSEMLRC